jgi:transcriptional regulator with GAF, ATPase, and Fis domain
VLALPLERLGSPRVDVPLELILRNVETALIQQSLERTDNVRSAARSLGLSPEALSAKMRRLGIAPPN